MWDGKNLILVQASVSGASRVLFTLPIEHPLDTLKTHIQLHGTQVSVREVISKIFQEKGVKGFYAGFWPNAIRATSKQLYRMPLTLGLGHFYQKKVLHSTGKNHLIIASIFTGASLASLETFIICPLERTKVWLMTHQGQDGWQAFKQNVRSKIFTELFRGLNAVYAKQVSSWMSFLVADEVFRGMARSYTRTDNLSMPSLVVVSLGVGLINTAVAYPFDTIKTLQQQSQSVSVEKKKVWSMMRQLFNQQGFKGLYAGWKTRIVQYMVQACVTVNLLDYLRRELNKLENKK